MGRPRYFNRFSRTFQHNFVQDYINKRVFDLFRDPEAIVAMGQYGGAGGAVQQVLTDAATINFDYSLGAFGTLSTLAANRNISFTNLTTPSFAMIEVNHSVQGTSINLPGKLCNGFAWSTALNGITMVNGVWDGTNWFWTSNTF